MTALVAPTGNEAFTLIDALLAEQGELSAVERFSGWQESPGRAPAGSYRHPLPLTAPGPGAQYAFEVNLDKCSGCKACVSACHSLNGLDEHETWRSVGLLIGGTRAQPHLQTVTTACHHCADPACANGCPVLAYDKDPLTGIVRHLDDQCIGCQYCVLMCPYEVPRYSGARGIVRKCDMCHQRLAQGEAPACVQACPDEAIRITVVQTVAIREEYRPQVNQDSERQSANRVNGHSQPAPEAPVNVRSRGRESALAFSESSENVRRGTSAATQTGISKPALNRFLPGSADPAITLPTTRYVSSRPAPLNLVGADAYEPRIQPAHASLVWLLVFTQLGAGGFALLPLAPTPARQALALVSLTGLLAGLAGSVLHLGQPLKAWRVFLNLRRSWLSREIVVFALFALWATAATTGCFIDEAARKPVLLGPAALLGILSVFSSGMVYHATQRECWRGELSIGRFFGTTVLLGFAAAWCAARMGGVDSTRWALGLAVASGVKLSRELAVLRRCPDSAGINAPLPLSPLARSAFLMRFRLGPWVRVRIACGVSGGILLPLSSLVAGGAGAPIAAIGLGLCLAGELVERALFFRSVATVSMPGGVAA